MRMKISYNRRRLRLPNRRKKSLENETTNSEQPNPEADETGERAKSPTKRNNAEKGNPGESKRRRADTKKSEYLITFTSKDGSGSSEEHKNLLKRLNDRIFELAANFATDQFVPRVDFAKVQEADEKSII